jgi:hypothetical protein
MKHTRSDYTEVISSTQLEVTYLVQCSVQPLFHIQQKNDNKKNKKWIIRQKEMP